MNTPTFYLEGVMRERDEITSFEGPLSVILMLLSRNKVEIKDISISLILDQYLQFIADMEEADLDAASEFVQMASHLLYIKTSALLRTDRELSELDALIESLELLKNRESYGRIKAVAPVLGKAMECGSLLGVKGREPQKTAGEYRYRHEGVDLLVALRSVFSRNFRSAAPETPQRIIPTRIVYNVREKSLEIVEWLRASGPLSLVELFARTKSRPELVAAFVSVLELCAAGNLLLTESEGGVTASLAGGVDVDELLEEIAARESKEDG